MSNAVQGSTGVLVGVSMTTSTSVATGILDTVSHYAPVIGLGLSLTSIMLAVAFFILNHRRDSHRNHRDLARLKKAIRDEVINEMKCQASKK